MNREQKILRRNLVFCLAGFGLAGFSLCAPDAQHSEFFGFITTLRETVWSHPLEWPAVWASLRVILMSFGAGLIIEGAGTSLMRAEMVLLGYLVFLLYILPVTGFFIGTFFLMKALF